MIDYRAVAYELCKEGYTYIDVPEKPVVLAREHFKAFVQRRQELCDAAQWCLQRPEEDEPDLGLICRGGGAKDLKWFFHDDVVLRKMILRSELVFSSEDREFIDANEVVRELVQGRALLTIEALEQWLPGASRAHMRAISKYQPYDMSALRSLYYPDAPEQKGAKAHIDRGFLTIHLGDEGGDLWMHDGPEMKKISPPPGKALLFFGVKVLWFSDGKIDPLWHSSTTNPGEDRFANVMFNHVRLPDGYKVTNAAEAEVYYWNRVHRQF